MPEQVVWCYPCAVMGMPVPATHVLHNNYLPEGAGLTLCAACTKRAEAVIARRVLPDGSLVNAYMHSLEVDHDSYHARRN